MSWRPNKTATYWPPNSSGYHSLSFPFSWAAQPGAWGPSLCWDMDLIPTHLNFLSPGLYNNLTSTHFMRASQFALNSTPYQSRLPPDIFDRMHLLFTRVHFFFWQLGRGQYATKQAFYCSHFCWVKFLLRDELLFHRFLEYFYWLWFICVYWNFRRDLSQPKILTVNCSFCDLRGNVYCTVSPAISCLKLNTLTYFKLKRLVGHSVWEKDHSDIQPIDLTVIPTSVVGHGRWRMGLGLHTLHTPIKLFCVGFKDIYIAEWG